MMIVLFYPDLHQLSCIEINKAPFMYAQALKSKTQRQRTRVSAYQLHNVENKVSLGVQQPIGYQRTVLRVRKQNEYCTKPSHHRTHANPYTCLSTYLLILSAKFTWMPSG